MFYDIHKSFAHNWKHGPTYNGTFPRRMLPQKESWITLFEHKVMSPIGVPACPWSISKGIAILSKLGFEIFTYKTVRSVASDAHTWPNLAFVADTDNPHKQACIIATQEPKQSTGKTLANSIGNVSFDPNIMQQDITQARSALTEGQLLMVSVYGSNQKQRTVIQDYIYTALLAQEAGAQAIECNLSCPNISGEKPLYKEPDTIYLLVKKMCQAVTIPVIIKIGLCDHQQQLHDILVYAARAGAQGVCGLNTIAAHIIDKDRKPFFGTKRSIAGLSGNSIRPLALTFIQAARSIIDREKLPLTLLGTGGITEPIHFDQFLNAGAQIVMSATGTFFNPLLAMQWHASHTKKCKGKT